MVNNPNLLILYDFLSLVLICFIPYVVAVYVISNTSALVLPLLKLEVLRTSNLCLVLNSQLDRSLSRIIKAVKSNNLQAGISNHSGQRL